MGKHKLHHDNTWRRDIILVTCILRTRVHPPVPYPTIAEYLIASSLDVAQKLAKRGAPRELWLKLVEDQNALRIWLRGHLEENYNLAEDWCSSSWQTARDCDVSFVRENLVNLGLENMGYEVKEAFPGTPRGEFQGFWTQTKNTERKHRRTPRSEGFPEMKREFPAPWACADIPKLLNTSISGKENPSMQTINKQLKYLRNVRSDGSAAMTAESPARLACSNVPQTPGAFVHEVQHLGLGTSRNRKTCQEVQIMPSHVDRGVLSLHSINANVPFRALSRSREWILSAEVKDADARRWKEHQRRVKSLLQSLETVQQKYRGNSQNLYTNLEIQRQPQISLPTMGHQKRPQLPRLWTNFDDQFEAIETLEQLHLEDKSAVKMPFPMTGTSNYGGQTEGRTLSKIARYGGDAGWIEMRSPS